APAGTGASTATWQFNNLPEGHYDVQVTWPAGPNRASDAKYTVYDGATLLGTVVVNQQLAPTGGETVNGVTFQSLGDYNISSGTLKVVLSNEANGAVIADAVRVDRSHQSLLDGIQAFYNMGDAPGTQAIDATGRGNDLAPSFALDSSDLAF